MLPSQFKRLIETLRLQLGSIRESVEKHEGAIRDASSATNEQQGKIPGIIASAIQAANEDVPTYEKTQRNKEYRQQDRLVLGTWLAFGAAAIYAAIAAYQGCLMHRTYTEIQRQTQAAALTAYATCINVQISRNSLISLEQSEEDSRRASVASAYQAEASISGQRAYIDATFDHPKIVVGQPIRVPYSLKNIGAAAATHFSFTAAAEFLPKDSQLDFIYNKKQVVGIYWDRFPGGKEYPPRDNQGNASSSIILWAKDGHPAFASQEDVDDFQNGRKTLYVYLKLSYDDVFGKHWLRMCHYSEMVFADKEFPIFNFARHPKCDSYNQSDTEHPLYILPKMPTIPPNPPEVACQKPEDYAPR
jgi:hypothetical protein